MIIRYWEIKTKGVHSNRATNFEIYAQKFKNSTKTECTLVSSEIKTCFVKTKFRTCNDDIIIFPQQKTYYYLLQKDPLLT